MPRRRRKKKPRSKRMPSEISSFFVDFRLDVAPTEEEIQEKVRNLASVSHISSTSLNVPALLGKISQQ